MFIRDLRVDNYTFERSEKCFLMLKMMITPILKKLCFAQIFSLHYEPQLDFKSHNLFSKKTTEKLVEWQLRVVLLCALLQYVEIVPRLDCPELPACHDRSSTEICSCHSK